MKRDSLVLQKSSSFIELFKEVPLEGIKPRVRVVKLGLAAEHSCGHVTS